MKYILNMKIFAVFFLLTIHQSFVLAESMYVGDTLRVGIRPKPDNSTATIGVIKTGAKVERLKVKKGYSKIRTDKGIEGWVKSAYLSNHSPAIIELKSAKQRIETLESQIQQKKNVSENNQNNNLQETVKKLQENEIVLQEKIKNLQEQSVVEEPKLTTKIASMEFENLDKQTIYIMVGAILCLFTGGFIIGVSWYKKQVLKRLGGLSI